VNLVRPAGAVPAGRSSLNLTIGRSGLFACAGVLAALNAQASAIINEFTGQPAGKAILDLAGISAIIWFALYAALKIGFEGEPEPVSKRDGLLAASAIALCFLPFASAARAALLICAFSLLASGRPLDRNRRVGLILLGLSGPLIWGPFILEGFADPLLGADAHLVGAIIGTTVDGNIVQFAGAESRFLIGIPCSSFQNMSLALVLWTTAAALFRLRLDLRYVAFGASMIIFMFSLNIARLSLIGLYPGSFAVLHEGVGAALFRWTALLGAAAIAFVSVDNAIHRQR
jgi:hypothetical protein